MLPKKELVGHAGNVIAHNDVSCFLLGEFFVGRGHRAVTAQIVNEKLFQKVHGTVAILGDDRMAVNVLEKEKLELAISSSRRFTEACKAFGRPSYAFHG